MKRMSMVLWMAIITLLLVFALPVLAQDDACDPTVFGEVDALLAQVKKALENGNTTTANIILDGIRTTIAPCIGTTEFSGGQALVQTAPAVVIALVTANADWTPVIETFDGVEMVLVPAGCFDMGSNDGDSDEQPIHEQCFDEPFWIDRYEVSQGQLTQFGFDNDNYFEGDNLPAEQMSWFEARDFCESRGMRLPTEAEWEYAARGPDNLVYPWGNTYNAAYVIGEDDPTYDDTRTAPVGNHEEGASWVDAYDLSGNVWEWVSTIYQEYPYNASDRRESNSDTNSFRVLRGGSFFSDVFPLRAANRLRYDPDSVDHGLGFRCALSYAP